MSQQTSMPTNSPMNDDRTEIEPPIVPPDKTTELSTSKHDTAVLGKNRTLRAMLGKRSSEPEETSLPKKELTLLIRGMPERVTLSTEPLILGRMEMKARGFQPDIDLSPYGAQTRGVSRVHARLFLQDDHPYIADLYSTNGTFVDGKRLEENAPFRLHNRAEVLLGSLVIEIVFD